MKGVLMSIPGEILPQQPCPPEVRGYISRMEELMRLPQYNHAGVPAQLAVELLKAGQLTSFAHFEACLRQMGSRVHFLAVPLDYFGDTYPTAYPSGIPMQGEPQFTLFTAVNGAEEAAQILSAISVTPEDNMARLTTTGVLTIPSSGQPRG